MSRRRTRTQSGDEPAGAGRAAATALTGTRRRGGETVLDRKLKELFDPVLEEPIPDSLLQILERSRRGSAMN